MQSYLSGRFVRELKVNRRSVCEWYETAHESSAITLFDVQKWMEEFQGDSNKEVSSLRQSESQIWKQLTIHVLWGSNCCNIEEDLAFVDREIAQCLQESSEREEFYPYPSDVTLENV